MGNIRNRSYIIGGRLIDRDELKQALEKINGDDYKDNDEERWKDHDNDIPEEPSSDELIDWDDE